MFKERRAIMNEHIKKEMDPLLPGKNDSIPVMIELAKKSRELTQLLYRIAKYNGYKETLSILLNKIKKMQKIPISDEDALISSLLSLQNTISQLLVILDVNNNEENSIKAIELSLKLAKSECKKLNLQ